MSEKRFAKKACLNKSNPKKQKMLKHFSDSSVACRHSGKYEAGTT